MWIDKLPILGNLRARDLLSVNANKAIMRHLRSVDVQLKVMSRLKEDDVLTFMHEDREVKLWLPWAKRGDLIQESIVDAGSFWEQSQLQKVRRYINPHARVLDIGANIGNHSVFFALFCDVMEVVAFEPQKACGDVFMRNVALNHLEDKVRLRNRALGAEIGKMAIARTQPANSGGVAFRADPSGAYDATTLDACAFDRIDFVKIDVEGAQLDVLRGGQETLQRDKPAIWVEMNSMQGQDGYDKTREIDEPIALLSSLGYSLRERLDADNYVFVCPNKSH